jgi:hypothetical protein
MEKVYTIETTGRSDFCIGAFADYDKAKAYYENTKPRVGKEENNIIELQFARGLQLVEWQGEVWEIIEDWEYKTED